VQINIRPIEPQDLPILMEAYKKMSADQDTESSAKEYLKMMVRAIWSVNPLAIAFVAEADGLLAGFISASLNYSPFETPNRTLVCDVTYVRAKYRKSGVARNLWEAMKKFIDESDLERIRVNLLPSMEEYNEEVLKVAPFKKEYVVCVWNRFNDKKELKDRG
jgi:GNAT superfamily N-acetyltransferase